MGVNGKTVTRYYREYEAKVQTYPEDGVDICLAYRPRYSTRHAERTKLKEAVWTEIDYWLHENARRRQTEMRKQSLKRQDIHRALTGKDFNISYSIYVSTSIATRPRRRRSRRTFLSDCTMNRTRNASLTGQEFLKDNVLCSTLIDRLCHKSYLVNMTSRSYQAKERKKNQ